MKKNKYIFYASVFGTFSIIGAFISTSYIIVEKDKNEIDLSFLDNMTIKIDESIIEKNSDKENIFEILTNEINSKKKYSQYAVKFFPYGSTIDDINEENVQELSSNNSKGVNWHFTIVLSKNGNPFYLYNYTNWKLADAVFSQIDLTDEIVQNIFTFDSDNEIPDLMTVLNKIDSDINNILKENFEKIILNLLSKGLIKNINNFPQDKLDLNIFKNNLTILKYGEINNSRIKFWGLIAETLNIVGFKNVINNTFEIGFTKKVSVKLQELKNALLPYRFEGKDNEFIYEWSNKFQMTSTIEDLTNSLSKYFTDLILDIYNPNFFTNSMIEKGIFKIEAYKSSGDNSPSYSYDTQLKDVWGSGIKKPYIWIKLSTIRLEFQKELENLLNIKDLSTKPLAFHILNEHWEETPILNKKTIDDSLFKVLNPANKDKNEFKIPTEQLTLESTVDDFLNFISKYITTSLKENNTEEYSFISEEMQEKGIFEITSGYKSYKLEESQKWDNTAKLSTIWGSGDKTPHLWIKLGNIRKQFEEEILKSAILVNDFESMHFFVLLGDS